MHTFYCYSHASVNQDKVIDFLASAQETVLLNFIMAFTGDIHKRERLCQNAKKGPMQRPFVQLLDRQYTVVRRF